jgi:hypothetical protein
LLFIDRQLWFMGIDVDIIGVDADQEFRAGPARFRLKSGFEADRQQQQWMSSRHPTTQTVRAK